MSFHLDRRGFLRGIGAVAATSAFPAASLPGLPAPENQAAPPLRLGVASYSFRKLGQPEVIRFMKELNTPYLNVKDVHLAMTPQSEIKPDEREIPSRRTDSDSGGHDLLHQRR